METRGINKERTNDFAAQQRNVIYINIIFQQILINPKPFLLTLINKPVLIRLKWGIEYKGILVSYDKYMNFQLKNTEEIIDNQITGSLGDVLVRCNNVLFVKECYQ